MRRRLARSLAVALVSAASMLAVGARAQDSTWSGTPGSGDFNTNSNWSAGIPSGTASFDTSAITSLTISSATMLGTLQFNADAYGYTLGIGSGSSLTLNGTGIVNNSANTQTINNSGGTLTFATGTTAGNATINNSGGILTFATGTSAGNATINNSSSWFLNAGSSAGDATINNTISGVMAVSGSAGNATIQNYGSINFSFSGTAANSTIYTYNGGALLSSGGDLGNATIYLYSGALGNLVGTAANATINNGGSLNFGFGFTVANSTITTNNGGTTTFTLSTAGNARLIADAGGVFDMSGASAGNTAGSIEGAGNYRIGAGLTVGSNNLSTAVTGMISGGSLAKVGAGALTLAGANSYAGGTTLTAGALVIGNDLALGSGALDMAAGTTLGFAGGNFNVANNITISGDPSFTPAAGTTQTLSGVIADGGTPGTVEMMGPGTLVLTAANTYSGGTIVSGGTLQLAGAGTLGAATATTTVNTGATLDLGGTTQTQASVTLGGGTLQNGVLHAAVISTGGTINGISDDASLTLSGGTTILSGTNSFAGTTVTNATLTVNGLLNDPTIGAGGVLTGTGSVGATTVNAGGTLSPGNGTPGTSLTVNGGLTLASGAVYAVSLNPTTSTFANVTGTATLGGANVNAVYAGGSYVSKQYTILTAAGGVSGTFGSLVNTNLPANFHTTLSYDANDAYLKLILSFAISGGLNGNQKAVGNALTNFFNTTGGIPLIYSTLTSAALTQASGESATGSQQTTFQAMGQFLGLLTDPFAARGNGVGGATSPSAYAEEGEASAYAARKNTDAFAMFTKAPPAPFVQRWSVWAEGYGGSQSTGGNAALGSNDTTSRIAGTAVGADYLFSPDTLAGFALAGGGTSFSVNNLGSGRSDLFQAGAYVRRTDGPAYVTGALAYGWQDITTNRTVSIAGLDQLRAEFNANAYSGRVEGGYRFVAPVIGGVGITPYAAGQFTTFDLPAYAESVVSGAANFALNYAARSVTDTRSELGIRTDRSFVTEGGVLALRGRLAWAHDFDPDRLIGATFQSLPGASFVVNGAAQASDSALTTASIEMKWLNGWSAAATFEGEFSGVTTSYAGKGVVRYAW